MMKTDLIIFQKQFLKIKMQHTDRYFGKKKAYQD